jgi:hypothetical protein
MQGLSHLLLDPQDPRNISLASNLAGLGSAMETIDRQPGGALLFIKSATPPKTGQSQPEQSTP